MSQINIKQLLKNTGYMDEPRKILPRQFIGELAKNGEIQRFKSVLNEVINRNINILLTNEVLVTGFLGNEHISSKELVKLLCSKHVVERHGEKYKEDLKLILEQAKETTSKDVRKIINKFLKSKNGLNVKSVNFKSPRIKLTLNANPAFNGIEHLQSVHEANKDDRNLNIKKVESPKSFRGIDERITNFLSRAVQEGKDVSPQREIIRTLRASEFQEKIEEQVLAYCQQTGNDPPSCFKKQYTNYVALDEDFFERTDITSQKAKLQFVSNGNLVFKDESNRLIITKGEEKTFIDISGCTYFIENSKKNASNFAVQYIDRVDIYNINPKNNKIEKTTIPLEKVGFERAFITVSIDNEYVSIRYQHSQEKSKLYSLVRLGGYNAAMIPNVIPETIDKYKLLFDHYEIRTDRDNYRFSLIFKRNSSKEPVNIIGTKIGDDTSDYHFKVIDETFVEHIKTTQKDFTLANHSNKSSAKVSIFDIQKNQYEYLNLDIRAVAMHVIGERVFVSGTVNQEGRYVSAGYFEVTDGVAVQTKLGNVLKGTSGIVTELFPYNGEFFAVVKLGSENRYVLYDINGTPRSKEYDMLSVKESGYNVYLHAKSGEKEEILTNKREISDEVLGYYKDAYEALDDYSGDKARKFLTARGEKAPSVFSNVLFSDVVTKMLKDSLENDDKTFVAAMDPQHVYQSNEEMRVLKARLTQVEDDSILSSLSGIFSPSYSSLSSNSQDFKVMNADPRDKNSKKVKLGSTNASLGTFLIQASYSKFDPTTRSWTKLHNVKDAPGKETGSCKLQVSASAGTTLLKPTNSVITKITNPQKVEIDNNNGAIAQIAEGSESGIYTYRLKTFTPYYRSEIDRKDYLSWVKTQSSELTEKIAVLPTEAKKFCDDIRLYPPAEQIKAVKEWIIKHGYYDMDDAQVAMAKYDKPLEERFKIMQERMKEISANENYPHSMKDKIFAGICGDFGQLTTAMFRELNIASGISRGYLVDGRKITAKNAHLISYALLPDQNGNPVRIDVDSTPSTKGVLDYVSDMINPNQVIFPKMEFPEFKMPRSPLEADFSLVYNNLDISRAVYNHLKSSLERACYGLNINQKEGFVDQDIGDIQGDKFRELLKFYSQTTDGKPRLENEKIKEIIEDFRLTKHAHICYILNQMLESPFLQEV